MVDTLGVIVEAKRREVDALERGGMRTFPSAKGPRRSFAESLARPGVGVIAEIKRRSPSRGEIRPGADPQAIAAAYERHGACAISVLTDHSFFGGSLEDLDAARCATGLPVLRKDFILDEIQIEETAAAGADAVLLIVAVTGERLGVLLEACRSHGLDALVEVRNADEVRLAVETGARVIGVNNRDLTSFAVDTGTTARLRASIPQDRIAVAESGITARPDVVRVEREGYQACLVGGALMAAEDPGRALAALLDRRAVEAAR